MKVYKTSVDQSWGKHQSWDEDVYSIVKLYYLCNTNIVTVL